ncbi:MAG: hypothetical protein HY721_24370 [Planctomycetes bacterium]|nr:hypothetical protein [Planctomycetota bacterium]
MSWRSRQRTFLGGLLAVAAAGLAEERGQEQDHPLRTEDFKGPQTCAACHPRHYLEWRGSAHAYSAVDPLVQACNRKALRDTEGKIGAFCVNCHAPLGARARELSAAPDMEKEGSPLSRKGISCEVCHRIDAPPPGKPIANASFELRAGNAFHGRLHEPAPTPAHESVTSELIGKSDFCGSCHDVLHNGALLEKSFAQWSGSVHKERNDKCHDCHMLRYSGQAAVDGPYRDTLHRHNFPGVTIPLVPFPNRGYQTEQVQALLRTAARMVVIVPPAARAGGELLVTVRVKNSGAGHNIPTGLANERQMWIEVAVTDGEGRPVFRSGHLDPNGDLLDHHSEIAPGADPFLVSFSDRFLDAEGKEVPFIWLASGLDERSLKPLEERSAAYRVPVDRSLEGTRLRVRVRLLFRPFPPYALRDLGLPELVKELPIWEMDSYASDLVDVVRELPRRTVHRVPGDFASIEEALRASLDGDRILVEPGEHPIERPLDFRGKAVALVAAAGPDRTTLRWAGDPEAEEGSVVVFRSGEGREARLEGFTIAGGRGTVVGGARRGGGILVVGASPTIAGNRIASCEARGGLGGGACLEGGSPLFERNEVLRCTAERGGGIAVLPGPGEGPEIDRCAVRGCTASDGGGLFVGRGAEVRLERTELAGNGAADPGTGSGGRGGAVHVAEGASLALDHATVVHNRAASGPGAIHVEPGAPRPAVSSSILWSNEPKGGDAFFCFSLLEEEPPPPQPWAATNRRELPLFRDPSGSWEPPDARWIGGDYRLLPGSPAIDAADPRGPADPDDTRRDIGAYFFEQPLEAFVRGDANGDGSVDARDLALLERSIALEEEVPCLDAADVDDSGEVDAADAARLASYLLLGAPPPAPPAGSCGLDPTFGEGLSCDRKGETCLGP